MAAVCGSHIVERDLHKPARVFAIAPPSCQQRHVAVPKQFRPSVPDDGERLGDIAGRGEHHRREAARHADDENGDNVEF